MNSVLHKSPPRSWLGLRLRLSKYQSYLPGAFSVHIWVGFGSLADFEPAHLCFDTFPALLSSYLHLAIDLSNPPPSWNQGPVSQRGPGSKGM